MLVRLSAFAVWALVAASAVFWGLRLLVQAPSAPAFAVPLGDTQAARADLARVLGSGLAPVVAGVAVPSTSSRFRLIGIIAPRRPQELRPGAAPDAASGVALMAVDGAAPKAYAVGARLDDELSVQSVSLRSVSIASSRGAALVRLELPAPAAPATGSLPQGGAAPVPASPPPVPPAAPPPYPGSVVPSPGFQAPTAPPTGPSSLVPAPVPFSNVPVTPRPEPAS